MAEDAFQECSRTLEINHCSLELSENRYRIQYIQQYGILYGTLAFWFEAKNQVQRSSCAEGHPCGSRAEAPPAPTRDINSSHVFLCNEHCPRCSLWNLRKLPPSIQPTLRTDFSKASARKDVIMAISKFCEVGSTCYTTGGSLNPATARSSAQISHSWCWSWHRLILGCLGSILVILGPKVSIQYNDYLLVLVVEI